VAASEERFVDGLRSWPERAHRHGALIAAQLVHDGAVALARQSPRVARCCSRGCRADRARRLSAMVTASEIDAMTEAVHRAASKFEYRRRDRTTTWRG